jgi:hypothetical protein
VSFHAVFEAQKLAFIYLFVDISTGWSGAEKRGAEKRLRHECDP